MINPSRLIEGFKGVVGLQQSNDPRCPLISSPLTDSSSGLYVQDKHPLVSLENIFYTAPDFSVSIYPRWSSLSVYKKNNVIQYNSILYIALFNVGPSSLSPDADYRNWGVYNPFQVFCQNRINAATTNIFMEVVKKFKLHEKSKAILERQQLYRGGGYLTNTIIPDGSVVGLIINMEQAEGLLTQIDEIGTQFLLSQTLNFYLYHTEKQEAKVVAPISVGGSSTFSWAKVTGMLMKYLDDNTVGSYLVCYYESDLLPGNAAISKEWDCNKSPCAGCDGVDTMMYNRWSRYTSLQNVKIPSSYIDIENKTLPQLSHAVFNSNTNWGFNLSLTIRCEMTDFILYNPNLYADAIAMQCCLEFLRVIAQSTRVDPAIAQIKNQARAELNLTEKSSYINRYWDSVNALEIDFSGFSKACQPCNDKNRRSMKIRSAL